MTKTAVTTAVFLLLLLSPSTAEIRSITIDSDTSPVILLQGFGFTSTGHLSIFVSSISVLPIHQQPPTDSSRLGFFLATDESLISFFPLLHHNNNIHQTQNSCVLNSPYAIPLGDFRQLSPPPSSSLNTSFPLPSPNEYVLGFANCAPNTSVSMKIHIEMYNLDSNGSKDFLPAGLTQIPSILFLFGLFYFLFLAIWIHLCRTHRFAFHRIHLLMGTLLLMKAINLTCDAEEIHHVKITGAPHGWQVLFYVFQIIRGVMLFTFIVLIGAGWSFMKPFLQEREKKVLMVVIPLQVLANVASIVIQETGPYIKYWIAWNVVFWVVDITCCCAVIFPVVWSIRMLRETSKTDGKAARNLAKLRLFRRFYVLVIGYLYSTRIAVFALMTIVAYQYRWVTVFADEAARLVFYVAVFYMFRPAERNEYFVLDEDEEVAAEKELKDEEFGL